MGKAKWNFLKSFFSSITQANSCEDELNRLMHHQKKLKDMMVVCSKNLYLVLSLGTEKLKLCQIIVEYHT